MRVITLTNSQRVDFLGRIRAARALILRDSESFREASTVLEHIGQVVGGKIGSGLKDYQDAIVGLTNHAGEPKEQEEIKRLFNVVREARNKAVHDGAYARHLNSRLIDLLLLLEEGIVMNMDRVEDLMVRTPVFAESWHLVSHVRKMMLSNSFSWIPIYQENDASGKWVLLEDVSLMKWIRSESQKSKQKARLALRVGDAISKHELAVKGAHRCRGDSLITEILNQMGERPTLVTEKIDGRERLVGILTAFDLL
jgi:CBS domain-containing protein